ncbi:MAG TPA: hypothetical protein VK466_18205 [Terriglobales bacterium]|nr:hypothetical protein [Terriglobales bacterium]
MSSDESTGAKRAPEKIEPAAPTSPSSDLKAQAMRVGLSEETALGLLKRPDLPSDVLEALAKNGSVLKQRKVKLALVAHPKTPRQVSLPLVRQLYIFELMQVALAPVVPADVKRAADEVLLNHLETVTAGERLTLAHRGSGRIAEELLLDEDARVAQGALQNPRLTEASIVRALMRPECTAALVDAVCRHAQWSLRREVRIALLRNEKTPPARASEFARMLPSPFVREILHTSQLPADVKNRVLKELQAREGK